MSRLSIERKTLSDIGESIRQKNGESTRYRPSDMAAAIRNISGGGGSAVIESKSITANGTYTTPTGVDGYNPVTVDVQPVLQSKTATQNGTVTPDSGYDGLSSVVVDVSGGSQLPTEYEEVTCIKGDGIGTYIDTGIVPNENTILEFTVALDAGTDKSDLNQAIIGSRKSNSITDPTASMFCVWHYAQQVTNNSRYRRIRCDYGYSNSDIYVSPTDITFAHIKYQKNKLDVNGAIYTFSGTNIDENQYSLYIGAVNTSGSPVAISFASFFAIKIFDGATLLRNYIPCVRKSDAIAGLYDLVNATFSSSAGTTNFASIS